MVDSSVSYNSERVVWDTPASVMVQGTIACPDPLAPRVVRVLLLMDGSASMAGEPLREAKKQARLLVQQLAMRANPFIEVAVVGFSDEARVLCDFSDRSSTVNGCIGRVGAAGDAHIDSAIVRARQLMHEARQPTEAPVRRHEVVILFGEGRESGGCTRAAAEGKRLVDEGMILLAVGSSTDFDAECFERITGGPATVYTPVTSNRIVSDLRSGSTGPGSALLPVVPPMILGITTVLAEDVVFESGSPPPQQIGADGRMLLFSPGIDPGANPTSIDFRYAFAVRPRPSVSGRLQLSEAPVLEYSDLEGVVWTTELPIPIVDVLAPAEGLPTPVPTLSPDLHPADGAIFLPAVLRNGQNGAPLLDTDREPTAR